MHIFCMEKAIVSKILYISEYKPYHNYIMKLHHTSLTFISQIPSSKKQI